MQWVFNGVIRKHNANTKADSVSDTFWIIFVKDNKSYKDNKLNNIWIRKYFKKTISDLPKAFKGEIFIYF